MKLRKPQKGDRKLTILILILVLFGSFMVASAEMGNSVGDAQYIKSVMFKQGLFVVVGFAGYFVCKTIDIYKISLSKFYTAYIILGVVLLSTRLFGSINGAYAWIPLGSLGTIQPSEFAKVFMICFASKLFNGHEKDPMKNFKTFVYAALIYMGIIMLWQNDTGSAIVLGVICYAMCLIPHNSEDKTLCRYRRIMILFMLLVLALAAIVLSPIGRAIISILPDGYIKGRFYAATDPFAYQYDYGYHIIMSLVSFANGGLFGLGYGNSIHKYMNFPNPSNDFILPVIVEELGIIGFAGLTIAYLLLLGIIARASIKSEQLSSKVILLGVCTYFICHFILNVGGVSGLIPLTGVPLLLISSGGSSLVSSMCALGFAQNEIIRNGLAKNADTINN